MYELPRQKGFDLYIRTFSWARLNFELQSILSRPEEPLSAEIQKKLYAIGYTEELSDTSCPKETEKLFTEGAFFSCIKTGNRIVAFALKENGLNTETFKEIEQGITDAYEQIRQTDRHNSLLERSYTYTLQALAVFKL